MRYEIDLQNPAGQTHSVLVRLTEEETGWIKARRFYLAQKSAIARAIREAPAAFFIFSDLRVVRTH